jgi:type VI secretion system protein ImpE
MKPAELYKAGRLSDAVNAQIGEVKANPADHARRLFLFELLVFTGDLDRARRQVDAVQYTEPELEIAQMAYRKLLDAEQKRRQLFANGLKPEFLAEAPEHVSLRLEAVNRMREKRTAEAAATLAKAQESTPAVEGLLNKKAFTALRDCDDLFSGVLEVMSQGNYFWVPFEQIDTLAMNAPKFPRDLIWVPARLEVRNGPAGDVFLPALYPQSHEHPDDQVKLGRMTDWQGAEGEPVRGVGLRMFLVGDDDISLLEWRQLEMAVRK